MAKWGKVDYRQLEQFAKKLEQFEKVEVEAVKLEAIKEIAQRMLTKVAEDTHVITGYLRANWTVSTVIKKGNVYEIEVFNPVEYGQYYEYGHMNAQHTGWVPGQFTMTIAANEIDAMAPEIVEEILNRRLREVFK